MAVLHTLRQLKDADIIACGLLGKVQTANFIGTIYILNAVLNILSSLNNIFQRVTINSSHIKLSIYFTLAKLSEIMDSQAPIVDLKMTFSIGDA